MKQCNSKSRTARKIFASAFLTLAVGCTALGAGLLSPSDVSATGEPALTVVADSDMFTTTQDVKLAQSNYLTSTELNKTALRIQSKSSGDTVVGNSFTFENEFTGDFDLDFRIWSKERYVHTQSKGYTHYLTDTNQGYKYLLADEMNPYADVQEVSFTFTSKSDSSKYFTVFVRGSDNDVAFATSAGVYIPGDQMFIKSPTDSAVAEVGKYGYGLNNASGTLEYTGDNYGVFSSAAYGKMYTEIQGTSFSNYSAYSSGTAVNPYEGYYDTTVSNMIKFDATNMKVYVNAKKSTSTYYNPNGDNNSASVLVRDLATNAGYTATKGRTAASLSAEDFAAGYTVKVEFSDMTSNSCVGDSSLFGDAAQYPTQITTPYDRYADMYIYSVNGTAMTSDNVAVKDVERTTIEYRPETFNATANYKYDKSSVLASEKTSNGLLLTSVANGNAADGISFDVQGTQTGNFDMDFRVFSDKTYAHSANLDGSAAQFFDTHWAKNASAYFNDMYNPYLDLKQVQFRFASVSNPEAVFTVYFQGATNYVAYRTSVNMTIGADATAPTSGWSETLWHTSFSNFTCERWKEKETLYNDIHFTVGDTLSVYTTAGTGEYDSTPTTVNVGDLSSLNASDFANGYTVSVIFGDVTDSTYSGALQVDRHDTGDVVEADTGIYDYQNGVQKGYTETIEEYDRYAKMLIYSINGKALAVEETYGLVVNGENKGNVAVDSQVNLASYTATKENATLLGWTLNGGTAVYAPNAVITASKENVVDGTMTLAPVFTTLKMDLGASIRLASDGTSGIRFIAMMDKAEYEAMKEAGIAFNYEISAAGGKTVEKAVTNVYTDETNGVVYITAAVTGITSQYFETEWTGKVYMSYTYAGATEATKVYATANDNVRTIKAVAQAAIDDHNDPESDTDYTAWLDVLNQFAGNA